MEFPISPPAQSPTSANGVRGRTSVVGHYRAISWRQGLVVLILLLLDGLSLGNARASEFDEYAVKAAYLYNFAKYVEWPLGMFTSANAPLLICIAGDNPFGDALTTLSGKMIESHPVEIRGLSVTTDLASCHIVFVSRAEDRAVFHELFDVYFRNPEVAQKLLAQMLPRGPAPVPAPPSRPRVA